LAAPSAPSARCLAEERGGRIGQRQGPKPSCKAGAPKETFAVAYCKNRQQGSPEGMFFS